MSYPSSFSSSAASSGSSEQPAVDQLVSMWRYKMSGFGTFMAWSLLSSSMDPSLVTIAKGGEVVVVAAVVMAVTDDGPAVDCCGCEMSMASSSSLLLLLILLDGTECESSRLGL